MVDSHSLKTSIVIPSLNSPLIDQVMEKILDQDGFGADGELIIVGRDDNGPIRGQSQVRFIDTGHPVTATVARNIGIDAAEGELLIFIDSDCILQSGRLREHHRAHAAGHKDVGGDSPIRYIADYHPTAEDYTAPPGYEAWNLYVENRLVLGS